jgi:hypothetical protein
VALVAGASTLLGAEIDPPFKLVWGESPARLERLLAGAKAKIVSKHPAPDGSEAWEVDGILQEGLKRTVFYFRASALAGVELQYRNDAWSQEKYDEFMGRWRRSLESRYGQGQLIARKTEPLENNITQTVVGYKWNLNNTALELVFFSAQGSGQVFRTLSVHYKSN